MSRLQCPCKQRILPAEKANEYAACNDGTAQMPYPRRAESSRKQTASQHRVSSALVKQGDVEVHERSLAEFRG